MAVSDGERVDCEISSSVSAPYCLLRTIVSVLDCLGTCNTKQLQAQVNVDPSQSEMSLNHSRCIDRKDLSRNEPLLRV